MGEHPAYDATMNLNRPELVRALMAAAALVLTVGVIGAFTVDADDTRVSASRETSSTSSTVPAEETTTSGVLEDTTATTTAASTATTSATTGTTASSANVRDPGPAQPPAKGTYVYTFTNSADPSLNGNNERKVEELPPEAGSPRRKTTAKDAAGNTLVQDQRWSNDGVRATASRITSGGSTIDCEWQPPLLEFALPLSIGKSWKADSTCKTMVAGTQVTIRRVADYKVTGKALDKVGDADVATWVIESTGTTTVRSAFYNDDTKEKVTTHYAARRGLVVSEKGDTETASRKISYELTLQSLTPK